MFAFADGSPLVVDDDDGIVRIPNFLFQGAGRDYFAALHGSFTKPGAS
jgi:hypothetical protein